MTKKELLDVQAKAKNLKAMVIGDVMLDRYIYGSVDRISPEAPVPILAHQWTEIKAGGSANVALNLASWGCKTTIAGIVGKDNNADIIKSLLAEKNIESRLIPVQNRPTTIKTRVVASSHHLLRIDEESSVYLIGDEEAMVITEIMAFLNNEQPDLVILQDYNKGLLTKTLISSVIHFCKNHDIFISVDPKDINFFAYHDVDLFKPNLREASQAAQKTLDLNEMPDLCSSWRQKLKARTIAITLGSRGIFLQDEHNGCHITPGHAIDVVDVCGAGDAVICSLSLGLISGLNLEKSGALANLTGAYVCSHSGVVAAGPQEIIQWVP